MMRQGNISNPVRADHQTNFTVCDESVLLAAAQLQSLEYHIYLACLFH